MDFTENLIKEFKRNISRNNSYLNVFQLPVPESLSDAKSVNKPAIAKIPLGVEYFEDLNEEVLEVRPRGTQFKRRFIKSDGSFRTDKEGNFLTEDVPLPKGSVAVLSTKVLGIPYNYEFPEGYGYVDFLDTDDGNGKTVRKFIYFLPAEFIYPLNMCDLVLSSKTLKGYEVSTVQTWREGKVFLGVVPYKPNRTYTNTRILAIKRGLDFSDEVAELIKHWYSRGIISNPNEYKVNIDGMESSLLFTQLPASYDEMDYEECAEEPLKVVGDYIDGFE